MGLFLSLFISGNNNAQQGSNYNYQSKGSNGYQSGGNNGQIEMKPMRDPKTGRIVSYLPLPVSWRQTNSGFQGPNGIMVNSMPSEVYYFNVDPYTAQMAGMQVANPVPMNTIFQQRIVPAIQQQGGKLIKTYPLQQIAQRSQQLMQSALNRSRVQSFNVLASEWLQPNGSKSLILMTQVIMHSQGASCWSIGLAELEAPAQFFDKAKDTYLYAQANFQVDRNTAMAHAADLNRMDRESQARLDQSRAAHNARMRSNEAAFQATQRSHTSTSNEISDMSMRGYWSRSDMQDRMRNKEINAIHQEYTVTNPWDNRNMQVQSGYQNYYINSQGDIIGSNDLNFNPNVHNQYNHTQWRKMKPNQR